MTVVRTGPLERLPRIARLGELLCTIDGDAVLYVGKGASVVPIKIAAGNVVGLGGGENTVLQMNGGNASTIYAEYALRVACGGAV